MSSLINSTRELWAEQRGGATFEGNAARVNVKIRNDYDAKLKALAKRMAKDYERQIKKTFNAEIEGKAFDSLSGQIGITLNELKTKWGGIFNKFSSIEAKKFVARLNKSVKLSAHNSLRELTKKTTIKTPDYTPEMQDLLRASIKQNVSLIKSIGEDYHNQVESLVLRSITTGGAGAGGIGKAIKANMAMMASIRDYGFKADKRASLIARDQTSKLTSAFNAVRMQSAGVEEFKWLHSKGGAEPRELHLKYDGQIFRYDDPPVIEKDGTRGLPGVAINCHAGDSIIEHRDMCNKVYRSRYSGELFTIVAGDDVVLRATPNHPVLTDRGWIPVKLLNKGDNLVGSEHERVNVMKADVDNVKSRFDDFFSSAARYIGHERTPVSGTGLEFHGDITDDYIDVVDFDSLLFDWIKPETAKKIVELILPDTDMIGVKTALFSGDSSMHSFIVAVTGASESVVSRLSALLSILNRSHSSANDTCLALGSNLYAMLDKNSPDDVSAYIEFSRNLKLAMSGGVEINDFIFGKIIHLVRRAMASNERDVIGAEMLGEIVRVDAERVGDGLEGSHPVKKGSSVIKEISSEYFSGHVYNLETASNWYVCNDIITHNCKCVAVPVIKIGS